MICKWNYKASEFLLNWFNLFNKSSGENSCDGNLLFEAGGVNGLEPVVSGGTTALTKIIVNSSNINKGKAPRMPGNANIGKRRKIDGP
ncbi:MAG: hypothetical protein APF81_10620 [Desulfosporosinus sp. BRH_c37]|nr:MAG: hypothetical protein APF81_10620 [Desulfosporosinus sp. BRH_c37]